MRRASPGVDERMMQDWFASAFGAAFLDLERQQVNAVMSRLFGCRLLQLGAWGWGDALLDAAPMHYHWTLGLRHGPPASAVIEGAAVPVPSRSMDAILIPHALEFDPDPRALLDEAQRVLADSGQLVILGFNPWSVVGVRRWTRRRRERFPWSGRPMAPLRLVSMLESLGLEIAHERRYGLAWPHLSGDPQADRRSSARRLCAPLSAGYLMMARKRVLPLTPSARPWPARPKLKPVAEPRAVGPTRVARGADRRSEERTEAMG